MGRPRTWGSLAPLIFFALIAVAFVVFEIAISGGIGRCPPDRMLGSYRVCFLPEPTGAGFSFVARFILGASVVLAVADTFRTRAVRLDLVAFASWTVAFVWVTSNPNVALSDFVCVPSQGICYQPWVPGFARMGLWFLISAAILLAGYLFRRLRFRRKSPAIA